MTADTGDLQHSDKEQSLASPGKQLKAAREQAGLTQREVAEALKLLPDQIGSLESNDFERFNGPLFCKAHLTAYAKLLRLDTVAIVDAYQAQYTNHQSEPEKSLVVTPIQHPNRGYSFKYWGAAAALVLSIFLWVQHSQQVKQDVNTASTEQAAAVEVDSNDQSSLMGLGGTANAEDSKIDLITAAGNGQEIGVETGEQSAVVIDLPARVSGSGVSSNTEAGNSYDSDADELRFAFAEDCWVEVTDGKGDIIYASLKQADETLKLTGTGPFKVLLGYAHGVSLDYNGEPIEINVKNRNNSARFVVGNIPVQ